MLQKAKPLFRGHKQIAYSCRSWFYDLRVQEVLFEQAEMAKAHGIDGFAFYHYWFGNGKQLLEKPFQRILENKECQISCLCFIGLMDLGLKNVEC